MRCGSGMYGRDTADGYQKSIGIGSSSPVLSSSARAAVGVVVVRRHVVGPALHRRRHELQRHLAGVAVDVVDHRLAVQRVGDGLADLEDVERGERLRERDVADVERRAFDQLQLGVAGDRLHVERVDEVVAVDLTGLQRLQARRVVGDRPEDHLVEQRRLAPVLVVAHDRQAVVADPRVELERPGADRVLRAEGALRDRVAVGIEGRRVGVELGQRRRAGDRERRQHEPAEEGGRRCGEVQDRRCRRRRPRSSRTATSRARRSPGRSAANPPKMTRQ